MRTRLKLFFKWGIQFENAYSIEEKSERKVQYADSKEVEREIMRLYPPVELEFNFTKILNEPKDKTIPRTKKSPV